MGGGMRTIIDLVEFGKKADYLTIDRQGRNEVQPPWFVGLFAKEFRAVMGNKPLGAGFSLGLLTKYRWIDSVQSNPELYVWTAEAIANGIHPSFGKTGATVDDYRWEEAIEKIFTWHYRVEKYLRNVAPIAQVAMVYSPQSAIVFKQDNTASLGMYQALIEARIPFEMVNEGLLDDMHLKQFKLLILPNIVAMSDKQCVQLKAFVSLGGSILATYETSLYDELGQKRENFGLSDLFNVKYKGEGKGALKNSFMRLSADPLSKKRHPILDGFQSANRIINSINNLEVLPIKKAVYNPVTLIPPYPNLPMEELYPRIKNTDIPLVYLNETEKGRVAYFPGDIDRTFWELLVEDHARLIKNVIIWALNEKPVVSVIGQGILDVTCWRQKDSLTVHMVDCNNPMAMRGYYREFIPLPAQKVRLQIPTGKKVTKVQLLVSNMPADYYENDNYLEVNVPSILAHEVIAVDIS